MSLAREDFVNDLVQPWQELNHLLIQPFAVNPRVSRLSREAGNLAIRLSHFPEASHLGHRLSMHFKKLEIKDSDNLGLIDDIADSLKHGKLDKAVRQNRIYVSAQFEVRLSPLGFRFLRNQIMIDHAGAGNFDLLFLMEKVMKYWARQIKIAPSFRILESEEPFRAEARLFFSPAHCPVGAKSQRMTTVRRTAAGSLERFDPPEVRVAVY